MRLLNFRGKISFLGAEQGKTVLALEPRTRWEISSLALSHRPVKAGPYLAPPLIRGRVRLQGWLAGRFSKDRFFKEILNQRFI